MTAVNTRFNAEVVRIARQLSSTLQELELLNTVFAQENYPLSTAQVALKKVESQIYGLKEILRPTRIANGFYLLVPVRSELKEIYESLEKMSRQLILAVNFYGKEKIAKKLNALNHSTLLLKPKVADLVERLTLQPMAESPAQELRPKRCSTFLEAFLKRMGEKVAEFIASFFYVR